MLKIKVVLGTTRQQRLGDQPAKWIVEKAKVKGLDVELLDLRDYPLPLFDEAMSPTAAMGKEGAYPFPVSAKWTEKIGEADGFIFTVAEYNHGYTAVLKNAFDYVSKEWNKKPVAFVGYGTVGAARAVEQLRTVVAEQQMVSIRAAVHMVNPWGLMDDKGVVNMSSFDNSADAMLDQLIWWTDALKTAREKDISSTGK
jgi:NAD(P)H-dependent FMN reductase